MIRRRLVPWLLLAIALVTRAPEAQAQAEFHKFNLMFSGNPSSFKAEDYKIYTDAELDEVRKYLKTLP